jgi:predicted small lipoprotein YifL
MKRILPLAILSLFFALAGCGAGGPDVSSTPETSALATKLAHEVRSSTERTTEGDVSGELSSTATTGAFANTTVIVVCNRLCVLGCGDLGDEACAYSCCHTVVRN